MQRDIALQTSESHRFGETLCKILYLYFVNLFLWLEHMIRVWWPYIYVPLPSTLSYGEGRMWQVTAYRHMICISPLCAISCLTHIYTVHFTLNTTHPHHIYLISGDQTKGRFCELRSGLVIPGPRWAWRSLITNLQLPETIEGEWVPIGFENQLSPLWKFGRGARDTFMKKKI